MIKGEIWWANLPPDPYGSEPGKRRPVLIIQNDVINRSNIKNYNLRCYYLKYEPSTSSRKYLVRKINYRIGQNICS
jgi:hypothetical protein